MSKGLQERGWNAFLDFAKKQCSKSEYNNWILPIQLEEENDSKIVVKAPNVFMQEYLLQNYKEELISFIPSTSKGEPAIEFIISEEKPQTVVETVDTAPQEEIIQSKVLLNPFYTFDNYIEGSSNQFIKSAVMGAAKRPGKTYNPIFIHGDVGLGKTHLLHAIGHDVLNIHKKTKIQCITTEGFINDIVDNLRNKSIAQMKRYYRSLDVLLIDDIQFLQNRKNFEEEFCATFESLMNQHKQIVITSDKPPSQLDLSQRLIARMEWGLVGHIGMPDLETRVAILQDKAERRGISLTNPVAFFIAERIFENVRQLEGAVNRLSAYSKLLGTEVTEDVVERCIGELFRYVPKKRVTVDLILKSVSSMFNVRVSDLKSTTRSKSIAFPRQVAMYLAKELIDESLVKLGESFGGKTHSTLLHSWNKIKKQISEDEHLKKQISMTQKNIDS